MNKFAVVTGTSSGIGLNTVPLLLEKGYVVFGGSRTQSPFDHPDFIDIELDIRDEESVITFFEDIRNETASIDLFIHAGGIVECGELNEVSSEMMRDQLETNVLGTFHLYKYLESFLPASRLKILNVLSFSAKKSYAHFSPFDASESARLGFIESIKKEWDSYDVLITNLFLGATQTNFWSKIDNPPSFEHMLHPKEFNYVLEKLIDAPYALHVPELTLVHRDNRDHGS